MLYFFSCILVLGPALQVSAAPALSGINGVLQRRNASDLPYTLPTLAINSTERTNAINFKRKNFVYGPSIAGNVSYWPAGPLGNSTTQADLAALLAGGQGQTQSVLSDQAKVAQTITAAGGIKQLSDYNILYEGQWKASVPEGVTPGILSNQTNDLTFSMERLSLNPYSVKRLNPTLDALPFEVEASIASAITSTTLDALFKSGSLFYVDHRYQAQLETTGRFAAFCDAYFYIHPINGDFLPLAIRTNVGSNLIYTPADSPNDWLLAKIMFNLNDFWQSQWYHLAATHNVIEIVYEAAYRTLSDDHPIMAVLKRITPQLFGYRLSAIGNLIKKGGYVDQIFTFSSGAAAQTTTHIYNSEGGGQFQANYFHNNLASRSLINSTFGPKLKSFPFYEDASVIHASLTKFFTSFVESYYESPEALAEDSELQAWIAEAVPATIFDFPSSVDCKTLVEILTQVAFLGSVAHHTINTNALSEASATLPLHPVALYQPPPTSKGVENIVPFLPDAAKSISQIVLTALFARPEHVRGERALTQMFNGAELLKRTNHGTREAAKVFEKELSAFGEVVEARRFDDKGLSQGMPFVWKVLSPFRAPYFLTI